MTRIRANLGVAPMDRCRWVSIWFTLLHGRETAPFAAGRVEKARLIDRSRQVAAVRFAIEFTLPTHCCDEVFSGGMATCATVEYVQYLMQG